MQDAKQSWEVVNQGPEMMLASVGGERMNRHITGMFRAVRLFCGIP